MRDRDVAGAPLGATLAEVRAMSSIEPSATTRAASASASAVAAPRDAIAAAIGRFMAAFREQDAEAVAACYTSDAQLLPAHSDAIVGREAITGFWRGAMSSGIAAAQLQTLDVDAAGDLAVETGRYELAGADGRALDAGKYLVAWHRDRGGAWRIHRDIWTTSRPA